MNILRGLRIDAISGKFIARDSEEKGLCGFQYIKEDAESTWVIEHERNINLFLYATFVTRGKEFHMVTPEKVEWVNSDTIIIDFFEPVSGFVNILYYTEDYFGCPNSENGND